MQATSSCAGLVWEAGRKAWEQGGGAASFRFVPLSSSCGSENQLFLRSGWRDFPSLLSGQQLDCLEPATMAFN